MTVTRRYRVVIVAALAVGLLSLGLAWRSHRLAVLRRAAEDSGANRALDIVGQLEEVKGRFGQGEYALVSLGHDETGWSVGLGEDMPDRVRFTDFYAVSNDFRTVTREDTVTGEIYTFDAETGKRIK